jgi:hypothetical protein
MLAPTISTSDRVNELSLKAALLFTWMIAHCDDQGRMSGDAKRIKALVVPLREDISEVEIPDLLTEIADAYLIDIYHGKADDAHPVGGGQNIQLLGWWDYQRLSEPEQSRYVAPKNWHDKVGRQPRDAQGRYARDE